MANDEELARSFSGTASVDKRSDLVESETLGNTKVRLSVVSYFVSNFNKT